MERRVDVINLILKDPIQFANTAYVERRTGLFSSPVLYSPYLSINNPNLTCVLNETCGANLAIFESKERKVYQTSQGILQAVRARSLNVSASYDPYINLSELQKYEDSLNLCLFNNIFNRRMYLGSDEYTNNLLISYFLSYIYNSVPREAGLKGVLFLTDSTIYDSPNSDRWGLNLYEESVSLDSFLGDIRNFNYFHNIDVSDSKGTLRMRVLTPNFILDLFKQLLVNLQMLQNKYSFNHGNLKQESVVIQKIPISIEYSTIRHKSELTFKLSDFRYASMGLSPPNADPIRLFNSNIYARSYFQVAPFKPEIARDLGSVYYTIDDFLDVQTLAKIRHLGIQFYSSFDTMTLVISLLLIPSIYYSVFTDSVLKNTIWDVLWHPKDESAIYKKLAEMMEDGKTSYNDIIDLLKGRRLKCKLTDELIFSLSRK